MSDAELKEAYETLLRMYKDQKEMISQKNKLIEELEIYRLAMESMAKQIIHPKITALEMARMQLGEADED